MILVVGGAGRWKGLTWSNTTGRMKMMYIVTRWLLKSSKVMLKNPLIADWHFSSAVPTKEAIFQN